MSRRKIYIAVLTVCLMFSLSIAAVAAPLSSRIVGMAKPQVFIDITPQLSDHGDMVFLPRWDYTSTTFTIFNIEPSGQAVCIGAVDGYQGITTQIKITLQLQQYSGGWNTYITYSQTFYDYSAELEKTRAVAAGYDYRLKATYRVYSGDDYETIICYSDVESY